MTARPGPALEGVTVVDVSSGIAGAYCGRLLSDAGATVRKIEDPVADALRRRTGSDQHLAPGADGALFRFLSCSKSSSVATPDAAGVEMVLAEVQRADIVIWSAGSQLTALDALQPHALRAVAPGTTVVAITGYGLDGPWADRPAPDLILQAWAGGIGHRGNPDRPPVSVGGDITAWIAGMYAAVGALTSLYRIREGGPAELVDVSALEGAALTLTNMHPVTFRSMAGVPFRAGRWAPVPNIEPTADGMIGFMLVTGQQWLDFCVLVEQFEWMERPELASGQRRSEMGDELTPLIRAWTSARTTDEVLELASLLRVPAAPIGNGATVPEIDHFIDQKLFVPHPDGSFLQPAPPFVLHGVAAPAPSLPPRHGSSPMVSGDPHEPSTPRRELSLPFDGLRVLDLTAFWAGPSASHWLALLGADVIHVESASRPDGVRALTTLPMSADLWWEHSPLFHATNTNKRGIAVDLQSEQGQALIARLALKTDVMIENFSPRVIESWGLDYERLREHNPRLIQVRMPAFGLHGPWRDRTGYAQTMEQVSGMAWMTGYADGPPELPNGTCDPVAGAHALVALLSALEQRRKTGEGGLVEVPMVAGALNITAEQLVEHSSNGTLLERDGNLHRAHAPHNLFLSADEWPEGRRDRWVAIAVETDDQWGALVEALGRPSWATEVEFDHVDGRRARRDEIDRMLGEWCSTRSSDEIVDTLVDGGVPVGKVMMPHEQTDVPQIVARGFFEELEHPLIGTHLYAGLPVRFGAGPAQLQRAPAPRLGQHTDQVLAELLGEDPGSLRSLRESGVIADRPKVLNET